MRFSMTTDNKTCHRIKKFCWKSNPKSPGLLFWVFYFRRTEFSTGSTGLTPDILGFVESFFQSLSMALTQWFSLALLFSFFMCHTFTAASLFPHVTSWCCYTVPAPICLLGANNKNITNVFITRNTINMNWNERNERKKMLPKKHLS